MRLGVKLVLVPIILALADNALRAADHPVPASPLWLTYAADAGPGKGKHIVLDRKSVV